MPCRAWGQPQPCPAPRGRSRSCRSAGAADPTPPACSGWLSQVPPRPLLGSSGLSQPCRGCSGPAEPGPASLSQTSAPSRCAGPAHATPRPALWDRSCSRRIPEGSLLCSQAPVCPVLCSPLGSGPAFGAQPPELRSRLLRPGSNSNLAKPPGLTFRPIHLFTGFMRKEDRKPLTYSTRGMVAMYFCERQARAEDQLQTTRPGPLPG